MSLIIDSNHTLEGPFLENNNEIYYVNDDEIYYEKKINKNYWKILLLIGVYYAIPSIQFIAFQASYKDDNIHCYFNYKCMKKFGPIEAFNNVISNIFYIIFGIGFFLFVIFSKKNKDNYGVYDDKSLYYALSISTIFEGIFSGIYHICPTSINFQFDTTFMFIGCGLLLISFLQKRSDIKLVGIFKLYGLLAIFNVLNVIELIKDPNIGGFWGFVFIIYFGISTYGSFNLYYGKSNWNIFNMFKIIFNNFVSCFNNKPKKQAQFLYLGIANLTSFILLIISATLNIHFSSFILSLFFINIFFVICRYIYLKIVYGESVKLHIWVLLLLTCLSWVSAVYFFEKSPTNKFLTPKESKNLNQPCILFNYWDSHDIWHVLSAFGILFMLLLSWTIDYDLKYIHKRIIHIF